MHATRILLSRPNNGLYFPPRTSWNIISSATKSCFNLLFSFEKREECLSLINDGVIKAPVLGIPMTLALYHDLSSPLFEKHGFDAKDFAEGANVALERFHEAQGQLMNEFRNENNSNREKEDLKKEESVHDIQALLSGASINDIEKTDGEEWIKAAEENPDSAGGQLLKMVTPEYFKLIHVMFKATNHIPQMKFENPRFVPGSTEIKNIALLSARAMEIYPTPVSKEEEEKLNEADRQKNDDILNNIFTEELPVVAQLEVLYDMNQTFTTDETNESTTDDNDESSGGTKSITRPNLVVALFEGWLHGSPDGTPLRWRLALNRPPWEFS